MIKEQIKNFLLSHSSFRGLVPADFSENFDLIEAGVLDSIGVFELIKFIEDELGIQVAPQDVIESNFRTLAAITSYVQTKTS